MDIFQDKGFINTRMGFDLTKYSCKTDLHSRDFIGRGSFGTVYRATLSDLSYQSDEQPYQVAMKVIPMSEDEVHQKYQKREMDFFNGFYKKEEFGHPNIIQYLGFIEYAVTRNHCIYMELCQRTLKTLIKDGLPEIEEDKRDYILHVAKGICSGVNYLHQVGIIHRDIAPSNILLKDTHDTHLPTVKVADFNLYTIHDKNRREDQSHTADVGQLQYRAREVRMLMNGKRKAIYGCAADVWSTGTVIYEMATGEKFNHLTEEEFWQGQLFRPDEKLGKLKDKALSKFLSKCLQWESGLRARCHELSEDEYMVSRFSQGSIERRGCGVGQTSALYSNYARIEE